MASRYRSTWGHKINHCFARQNSQLVHYDSAQFGVIMAINTLDNISISKGQEIFLHYGYSYSAGPKWYKDSFINILKQQIESGNEEDIHAIVEFAKQAVKEAKAKVGAKVDQKLEAELQQFENLELSDDEEAVM